MTTIGSLFTGYGGLDMGVAMALDPDARVAWTSDVAPGPCKLAATRWPDTPNLGDITKVNWAAVEPVDIICGGSPCQDLSLAGKRAGMASGTRSGLWESMAATIETIRPRLVVWENVLGALSARAYSPVESEPGNLGNVPTGPALRAAGRVAGDLATIGYSSAWGVVRASDAGAPHQRARFFLIGYPDGKPWDVRRSARSRKAQGGRALGQPAGSGLGALIPTPTAGYGPNLHEVATGADMSSFGPYAAAIARWEQVTGRAAPSPSTPARRAGCKPQLSARFVEWMMGLPDGHVTGPDLDLPREHQLRLLGNGVVPQQAALAVRQLTQTVRKFDR